MKVQITIRGRQYTVRSDEDGVDLAALAAYVDDRMSEVASRSPSLDDYTVAMLAALNIASEFERHRRRLDERLAALDRELGSAGLLLDAALPEGGGEE